MSLADVIEELANDNDLGRTATITWPADGGYNPATRTVSAGTSPSPESVRGIVQSAKTEIVDGVGVLPGDRTFMVAASAVSARPREGGTVTFGGDVYSILAVSDRHGASLIGYVLHLRGVRA